MKKINLIILASAATLFTACVNGDDYGTPDLSNQCTTLTKTKEVSDIAALATSPTPVKYNDADIIEAYVTSSDLGGNFYKSISFVSVDGNTGFSIPIDDYNLYTQFEPGRKVYVNMKNRYIAKDFGSTLIGSLYNNDTPADLTDDEVGRIAPVEYKSVLTRSCDVVSEESLVNRGLTITQIKTDANINKLIEIDNVQFTDPSLGKKFYDASLNSIGGATNHEIVDANGAKIVVRVSEFATFANKAVPSGNGKIRGVLTKFGSTYQFMIRTENDVKMTNPRVNVLFEQNFESLTSTGNNQFINLSGWSNVSLNGGAERWEGRTFNNNKYAQLSSFGTGETNMDTWLITPGINLNNTINEYLTFGSKIGFANGVAVTVWASTNYNGANTAAAINSATWTQLNPIMAPQTTSFPNDYTNSGQVDLSSYNGTVYIAFRYVGSSTGITSTYQIDDLRVVGAQ
ncbi:DUF5689 domain-containing protein [Flavobacterium sp. SM15]|uniref:DUF5689 domain-containing protein n=1 Tax=Flavobacterium sp. SM15 TaxID=2908005 RepID=UPI001EDC2A08|nr:DUF5689 domain-containing protein [Flavobacterium sp. SM15]MCG2612306.1 DUF5689 domain-containing protein [Flavobacterium sp. SM15]